MSKTTYTTGNAKKLAKRLTALYKKNQSWRKVAEQFPGVNFATLNRIATHKGTWLPKNKSILEQLGISTTERCITCNRKIAKPRKAKQAKRIDHYFLDWMLR